MMWNRSGTVSGPFIHRSGESRSPDPDACGKTVRVRPSGRRWLVVLALFVVTYGISTPLAAYGVFLPVLEDTFGWSRGAIATALSINLLIGGLAGWIIGMLADRHGPRVMLVATVSLAGASFAMVSTVGALWQLYLFAGLLGGIGMSSFYLLASSTVSHWFDERRGLALALVLVGFNLGYISGGPLAAWLIARLGWRPAYAVLGVGCGLVTLAAALTVREPRPAERARLRRVVAGAAPPTVAPGLTMRDALGDARQWYLNVAWFLMGGLGLMMSVHVVPFARDQGISLAAAALSLTAYGGGAVTGRLVSGAVSDRVGAHTTIRIGYAMQAVSLAALSWVTSRDALLVAVAVFGAGFAASDTMITKIVPEVFGMRALGGIMGLLTLGWRTGAAVGPAAAGFLYDATGSYAIPFGAAPIVLLVSWVFFGLATRRGA
jgi:MFS transporter, OFA family, oxalate/formate antiporter